MLANITKKLFQFQKDSYQLGCLGVSVWLWQKHFLISDIMNVRALYSIATQNLSNAVKQIKRVDLYIVLFPNHQ